MKFRAKCYKQKFVFCYSKYMFCRSKVGHEGYTKLIIALKWRHAHSHCARIWGRTMQKMNLNDAECRCFTVRILMRWPFSERLRVRLEFIRTWLGNADVLRIQEASESSSTDISGWFFRLVSMVSYCSKPSIFDKSKWWAVKSVWCNDACNECGL